MRRRFWQSSETKSPRLSKAFFTTAAVVAA
jgi:hypothetical protein